MISILAAVKYFFHIAFDGSRYHGWQKQKNGFAVQEAIEKVLERFTGTFVKITGCGRTDTGVHARNYYFHAETEKDLDASCVHSLNRMLPKDVVLYRVTQVHADAHARYDAISRTYRYYIHFYKNPFIENYSVFQFPIPDTQKMNEACEILKGFSDFRCFSKKNTQVGTFLCNITHAGWTETKDGMVFEITANRFLRNMVRAIVGTMLDIGNNKISREEFLEILESGERSRAGESVPPQGLFLENIVYPFLL